MPATTPARSTPSKRTLLGQARACLDDAQRASVAGDHRRSVEQATRAKSLTETVGHQQLRATALSTLALSQLRLGDVEAAVHHGVTALPLLKRARAACERTHVLCTLVLAHNEMGLHTDALDYATQAVEAGRLSADDLALSWALNRAGSTYEMLGDPQRGEPLMLQAIELARRPAGGEAMFSALNNLCSNLLSLAKRQDGEPKQSTLTRALQIGAEALVLAESSGNAHRQGICLGNLANVHLGLGDPPRALTCIERQEALSQRHGYRGMLLTSAVSRAELEQHRGDLDAAIRLFNQALAAAHDTDDHAMLFDIRQGLYESHKQQGDFAAALMHHEAMLSLQREALNQRADRQARLLLNRIDIENAQAAAERARLDAEVQRLRATQLESENHQLASKAIELGKHAMEDQLTGLANRRRVDHELPAHHAYALERRTALSLAALDLDHFKAVNDHHGHAVGDDVLRTVARILKDNTRDSDLLARVGGEEFLVLFIGAPLQIAAEVCERLRRAVEAHDWQSVAAGLRVTISIGLCNAVESSDVRALLERADASLYLAKRSGRNRVSLAPAPVRLPSAA
jgi:diguanylate cyclase